MNEVISKVIPIILLVSFGYFIQTRELADKGSIAMVKKAIINISLPAVLFLAFKNMDFKPQYLLISCIVIIMLVVFYFAGLLLNLNSKLNHTILPFLTTGYSFGLLTIPLFGAVYGIENIGIISIFGVGHELFIWFIYLTLLRGKLNGERFSLKTIRNFFTSPIILSILLGLIINLTGLNRYFSCNFVLNGVERTLGYLASTATPIILIVVGYGLKLEHSYLKTSIRLVLIRVIVTMSLGYIVKLLVINPIIGNPHPLFNIAYFTFLISPPPFSLAIFVGEFSTEKNATISNNATVISTAVSILIFLIATFIM